MPDTEIEAGLRHALARQKLFATSLLGFMGVLMLASYALPPGWGAALLEAASKAGFVGGIADWFAVTALFRHPLGLPIPHTAIIPREKDRLGRALGRFVASHVFTGPEVSNVLARLDVPGILRRFLSDPSFARPAAQSVAGTLPRVLGSLEDGRAQRMMAHLIPRMVGGAAAGQIVARALRGMVEGGRHQEVFGFVLTQLRELIAEKEMTLETAIEERVREQGGRLLGWAVGAAIARRVMSVVMAELDKMSPDGSELRAAFDEWVRREIERMETDPERAKEVGMALRKVVAHETVLTWVWDIWSRLRAALEADALRPDGRTVGVIEGALDSLGTILETDPAARERVNAGAARLVTTLLPAAQMQISDFIASVIGNWDAATITEKLELRVGKDLQFVRVNGTIVGFLVGGALYAALRGAFGWAAF